MKSLFRILPFVIPATVFAVDNNQKSNTFPSGEFQGCISQQATNEIKNKSLNNLRRKVYFTGIEQDSYPIEQRMAELDVSGVSIAVIKNNVIDWSSAHGLVTKGTSNKVNCNTLFQAASLSKPLSMMSILNMVEKEVVELDKNIDEYLSRYQLPKGKQSTESPVTLRNLLNHTSGLTSGGYLGYDRSAKVPSNIEVVKAAQGVNSPKVEVKFQPGTQLRYSGGAYMVSEIAIEDHLKKPFAEIMNDWAIKPMGMTKATFYQPTETESVAHGHVYDGSVIPGGWKIHPELAAAGLWSNATDLAKFLIEISKGYRGESAVYSKKTINELLKQEIEGHYYGFIAAGEKEDLALAHFGGNMGYRAAMIIHLKTGDGAVILTNSDHGSSLASEIMRGLSKQYNWSRYKSTMYTKTELHQASLQPIAGTYKFNDNGWQIDVEYDAEQNDLSIIFPNKDHYRLTPTTKSELHFVHPDSGVEAVFVKTNNNFEIKLYGQTGKKA